jgi:hypothetical protein
VIVLDYWPLLVAAIAGAVLLIRGRWIGVVGGLISLAGLTLSRIGWGGPGVEEATLVLASLGAAMAVSAGAEMFDRRPGHLMAVITSLALVVISVGTLGNGRYGLPSGEVNERLGFSAALAGPGGPGRILVASTVREDIPGEARPGPGFWYRVLDGSLVTMDEAWLPAPLEGDARLEAALGDIGSGGELRPGQILASFGVDWVVLAGPEFRLDEVLVTQLDMVPTPLDPESRVYENLVDAPLADAGDVVWVRDGTGFAGPEALSRVRLALNYDPGWGPEPRVSDWAVDVSGDIGRAEYVATGPLRAAPWLVVSLGLLALGSIVVARARR